MAEIVPFIGTRYDTKVVGDAAHVVCPPYDVIPPSMQDDLYKRHKQNFVRLVLGKEIPTDDEYNNRYERAAACLREWKQNGILVEDEELGFYLCEQEFTLPSGKKHRRRGFFTAVRLEQGPDAAIRGHEATFPGPKADRLKLLRATQSNLSPIVVLCPDADKKVAKFLKDKTTKSPDEEFIDTEGVKTRLWICQNPNHVQQLQDAVRDRSLLIADGHHRYETALAYQAEMRKALGPRHKNMPFDYTMIYLMSMEDEGLVILPTHRALSPDLGAGVDLAEVMEDLDGYFTVERVDADLEAPGKTAKNLLSRIEPDRPEQVRMAMLLPNRTAHVLTLKEDVNLDDVMQDEELPPCVRTLDISILHSFIINRIWIGNPEIELDDADIIYSRNAEEILDKIKRRHACVAFLVNAPRIDQVRAVVDEGLRMPPKSTYFYPKVSSGIVSRDISRHQ